MMGPRPHASLRRARRCCEARDKPRTRPLLSRGWGLRASTLLRAAGDSVDLPVVTEVLDVRDAESVAGWADVLQVGARNSRTSDAPRTRQMRKPILLKRGCLRRSKRRCRPPSTCSRAAIATSFCASGASERSRRHAQHARPVGSRGAQDLTHCRSSPTFARTGPEISSRPMSRASITAGADGVMVEVASGSRARAL